MMPYSGHVYQLASSYISEDRNLNVGLEISISFRIVLNEMQASPSMCKMFLGIQVCKHLLCLFIYFIKRYECQ